MMEKLKQPVPEEEKKEMVFAQEQQPEKVVTPIQMDPFSSQKQAVQEENKAEEQSALEKRMKL